MARPLWSPRPPQLTIETAQEPPGHPATGARGGGLPAAPPDCDVPLAPGRVAKPQATGVLSEPLRLQSQVEIALGRLIREPRSAIPGVSYAVRTHGGDRFEGAVGVKTLAQTHDGARPMTADTLTNRASTSKMITAIMTHKLAELLAPRGVELDVLRTPIRSLAPFSRDAKWSYLDGLTFHDLLTHRAGLARDSMGLEPALTSDETLATGLDPSWDAHRHVLRPAVRGPGSPGASFRYSNQGYNEIAFLLGELAIHHRLLEHGIPGENPVVAFQALTESELIRPLGLESELFYEVPDSEAHRLATSYGALKHDETEQPVRARLFDETPRSREVSAGSWGLYASDRGLSTLVEALTRAARGIPTYRKDGPACFSPPVITLDHARSMFQPYVVAPGEVYGHGVFAISGELALSDGSTRPYRAVGHSGGSYGSNTYAFTDVATGTTVTLATNTPDADRKALFETILAETLDALHREGKLVELGGPSMSVLERFASAPTDAAPTVRPPADEVNRDGEPRELSRRETPSFERLPEGIRRTLVEAGVFSAKGVPGRAVRLDSDVGFGGRDTLELRAEPHEGRPAELTLTLSSAALGKPLPLPLRVAERGGEPTLSVRQTEAMDFAFGSEAVRISHDASGELRVAIGSAGTHTWVEDRKHGDNRVSPRVPVPVTGGAR